MMSDAEVRRGLTSIRRWLDVEQLQAALDRKHPRRRAPHVAAVYALARAVQCGEAQIEMRTIAKRARAGLATAHHAIHAVVGLGAIKVSGGDLRRKEWNQEERRYEFRRDCLRYSGGLVWSEDPSIEVRDCDRTLWGLVLEARAMSLPESILLPLARAGKTRKLSVEVEQAKFRKRLAESRTNPNTGNAPVLISNPALSAPSKNNPNTSRGSGVTETINSKSTSLAGMRARAHARGRDFKSKKQQASRVVLSDTEAQLLRLGVQRSGEGEMNKVLAQFVRASQMPNSPWSLQDLLGWYAHEAGRVREDIDAGRTIENPPALTCYRVRLLMASWSPDAYSAWKDEIGIQDDLDEAPYVVIDRESAGKPFPRRGHAAALVGIAERNAGVKFEREPWPADLDILDETDA